LRLELGGRQGFSLRGAAQLSETEVE
jgi:hypothetical protein